MLGVPCECAHAQVFGDDPGSCHKCGRSVPHSVTPSTMRMAVAIAEVIMGHRRVRRSLPHEEPDRHSV